MKNKTNLTFFENNQNKIMMLGLFITLTGIILLILPPIIGLDGFNGGFALQFISVALIIPIGITTAIMYRKRANALTKILNGQELITYWKYGKEEWLKYAEDEYARDKSDKNIIFIILIIISAVVMSVFFVAAKDKHAALIVAMVLIGIIIFIKILVLITTKARYIHNKNNIGDVYIGKIGVYLNKRLHTWGVFLSWFEGAVYNKKTKCIEITYSIFARQGKDYNTVRVPVPKGKEKEAEKVLKDLIKYAPKQNIIVRNIKY